VGAARDAARVTARRGERGRQRDALPDQRHAVLVLQAHVGAAREVGAGERAVEPAIAGAGGAGAVDADRARHAVVVDEALAAEAAAVGIVAGSAGVGGGAAVLAAGVAA